MHSIYLLLKDMKPLLVVIYLATMGFLCVSAVQWHFSGHIDILPGIVFTGFIFGIYVLNRYTDTREDFANDVGKFFFFSERKYLLYAAFLILSASCLALFSVGRLNGYHLLVLAIGVAYSYKLIPYYSTIRGSWTRVRIKDIPGLKNLVVAFLWGASVFAFPLLYRNHLVLEFQVVVLFALALFFSTLNNTLFDDIRDVAGDSVANIKTLPTLFGERACIYGLSSINIIWAATILAMLAFGLFSVATGVVLFALAVYPLSYLGLHTTGGSWSRKLEVLPELDLLIFAGGIISLHLLT